MTHLRRLFDDYGVAFRSFSLNARRFLSGMFLLGIGANQISLLFSLYLKRMDYTEAGIGAILATRALGSTLVALPASMLAARFDSRRVLPVAALLTAAAYVAQSLCAAGAAIAAAVFMAGAISTVFQVSSGPFFMRNSGQAERMHLFSLNGALSMGTGLIGSLLGGALKDGLVSLGLAEIAAYRVALVVGAAFVLAAAIPFSRIVTDPIVQSTRIGKLRRLEGIDLVLWFKLVFPGFLVGLGAGLTIPYLNLYFKNVFGLSDTAIGAAVAAGQIATFAGMAAGPAIAKRLGKPRAVFWTQMLSVPLILVLGWVHALPFAILAYLARQVLMNMSTPIQDNFSLELVPPERQSLMNAIKMLSWTGSWTIAARISGDLIYRNGFATSFALTASLYALSTLCYRLFFIPRRITVA
ncbi:MAG TPA: MFS transporter [bacterium]|nr:MFS transporter [bacterium]